MNQQKIKPWLDGTDGFEHAQTAHFFDLAADEIVFCINTLKRIDMDGLRPKPDFIQSMNFVAGFIPDNSTMMNQEKLVKKIETFFNTEINVFWIPAKDEGDDEALGIQHEYDPPLIAKTNLNIENFNAIRSGMMQWRNGSFYCLSQQHQFFILFVDGYYSILAGKQEFVASILGSGYLSSWHHVIENIGVDPLQLPKLRAFLSSF
jgi:hypothetical protein